MQAKTKKAKKLIHKLENKQRIKVREETSSGQQQEQQKTETFFVKNNKHENIFLFFVLQKNQEM